VKCIDIAIDTEIAVQHYVRESSKSRDGSEGVRCMDACHYADNGLVIHGWSLRSSSRILAAELSPLVRCTPIYMHPIVAKLICLDRLTPWPADRHQHGGRGFAMILSRGRSDRTDDRYRRLIADTQIIKVCWRVNGRSVQRQVVLGQELKMTPPLPRE